MPTLDERGQQNPIKETRGHPRMARIFEGKERLQIEIQFDQNILK